jgi:glycosyltransferase involved in cell wall biosynthesis
MDSRRSAARSDILPHGQLEADAGQRAKPKPRVCMVSLCYYRADPRLQRQAEALVAAGYQVDVICQRQPTEPQRERLGDVTVHRLGGTKYRGRSLARYALVYGQFFVRALVAVTSLHRRHGYAAIQVYSMPEALVLTALVPRLTGVPLVYDAGDLTTELYAAKFGTRGGFVAAGALRLQEWLGLSLADLVVTVHEDYRSRLLARAVPAERICVVMNLPDDRRFHPGLRAAALAAPRQPTDELVMVHHGSLVERYGADLAVEAVARLRGRFPGLRLEVYGDGDLRPRLADLVARLGVADRVRLSPGYVPLDELPPLLARADMAVVPTRADPFTETILPNKLLEYLALGLPTVVSRTRTVEAHVESDVVEYCAPGDLADLGAAIERVCASATHRETLSRRALAWSAAHRWADAAAAYAAAINAVVAQHGRATPRLPAGGSTPPSGREAVDALALTRGAV